MKCPNAQPAEKHRKKRKCVKTPVCLGEFRTGFGPGPAECARPSLSFCKAYTALICLLSEPWPNSKCYAHSAGPDSKHVFSRKHPLLVGFKLCLWFVRMRVQAQSKHEEAGKCERSSGREQRQTHPPRTARTFAAAGCRQTWQK